MSNRPNHHKRRRRHEAHIDPPYVAVMPDGWLVGISPFVEPHQLCGVGDPCGFEFPHRHPDPCTAPATVEIVFADGEEHLRCDAHALEDLRHTIGSAIPDTMRLAHKWFDGDRAGATVLSTRPIEGVDGRWVDLGRERKP